MEKFIQNNNNFAIAYYRYSSSGQNEASIDQQREQAHLYAKNHDLTIIKEYADSAMTGTSASRPQYQMMLSEVKDLHPAYLILWKTDRLGRDRFELVDAKRRIRNAGCLIHCVAEAIPEGTSEGVLLESLIDGMAEFYSRNLSQNVMRGLHYNAEKGLYYRPIYGYQKTADKHYEKDNSTAPIVQKIFFDYANGRTMADICEELNSQGLRTLRGKEFNINSLRNILHNRSYIGEYHFCDIVKPDGMPVIISEELFEKVQKRLKMNKRIGGQIAKGLDDNNEPRYWLTGYLYCGHCGKSMNGIYGTSHTKQPYYYYHCSQNKKQKDRCHKKNVKKELIENIVIDVLKGILDDTENLASLAVDISDYYNMNYADDSYLKALESELKNTEKSLNNLVKALENGIFSETTQKRLTELEEQKKALTEVIEIETVKQNMKIDTISIKSFFEKYKNADFTDAGIRDTILEYFIDKIYVYDDKLIICCRYSDCPADGIEISLKDIDKRFERFAIESAKRNRISGSFFYRKIKM